ncbi:MAG: DUF4442 domain-containing protein [Bacteroidota bacterium]|nr:DUF4442 domain-containing protein [Bacteroidota bacterium]
MTPHQAQFFKVARHPFQFRLYLMKKLPAAYFSGVRILEIDEQHCTTRVRFKWLTQNPFRSIYFASLAMAAELSSGALVLSNVFGRKPSVSMLVVKMEAEFYKKATGKIQFTCLQGEEITRAVDQTVGTGQPVSFTARAEGKNQEGITVAVFTFHWSLKAKSPVNPG